MLRRKGGFGRVSSTHLACSQQNEKSCLRWPPCHSPPSNPILLTHISNSQTPGDTSPFTLFHHNPGTNLAVFSLHALHSSPNSLFRKVSSPLTLRPTHHHGLQLHIPNTILNTQLRTAHAGNQHPSTPFVLNRKATVRNVFGKPNV